MKEPGFLMPIIDLNDCSGKGPCVPACPYDALELRKISADEKKHLNLKGKIKTFFNANKAYLIDPMLCHGCGECVKICPEKAIKLRRHAKN